MSHRSLAVLPAILLLLAATVVGAEDPTLRVILEVQAPESLTAEAWVKLAPKCLLLPGAGVDSTENVLAERSPGKPYRYTLTILRSQVGEARRPLRCRIVRGSTTAGTAYVGEVESNLTTELFEKDTVKLNLPLKEVEPLPVVVKLIDKKKKEPLVGEQVALMEERGESAVQVAELVSDKDGKLHLHLWPDRQYSCQPKLQTDMGLFDIPMEGLQPGREFEWQMAATPVIYGTVYRHHKADDTIFADMDGLAFERIDENGTRHVQSVPVTKGAYAIRSLSAGTYHITIGPLFHATHHIINGANIIIDDRTAGKIHHLVVGRRKVVKVTIVLVDETDHKPIAGAKLSCRGPDGQPAEHQTDDDGSLALSIPEGNWSILVDTAGYRREEHRCQVGKRPKVELACRPLAEVTCTLRDETGRPVADAEFSLVELAARLGRRINHSGKVGADGTVVLKDVPVGKHLAWYNHRDFATRYQVVTVTRWGTVKLVAVPGRVVTGTVSWDLLAQGNADLYFLDREHKLPAGMVKNLPADGTFSLRLCPGSYEVHGHRQGKLYRVGEIEVPRHADLLPLELAVDAPPVPVAKVLGIR